MKPVKRDFFIGDLHFGHANIIGFDQRPFSSVEEMNETLIQNWNSEVKKCDTVYILGDFCWGKELEWIQILDRLKGQKVLIRGNHDLKNPSAQLKSKFLDIKDYKKVCFNSGIKAIMSHYPILAYEASYNPNMFMLYGHVHRYTSEALMVNKWIKELRDNCINYNHNRGQLINVGCMMPYMDYTPRTLDYLIDKLDNGLIV